MRRLQLLLIVFLFTDFCHAQTIGMSSRIVDERIPDEAAQQLETKLQSAITSNGFVDNGYVERYVLTAKVDITQKDVARTTPPRISEKMDITLIIGDVLENKTIASVTLQTAGIGINENKTLINAFRNIKVDNPKIQQVLNEAKTKILDYYTNHCSDIIQKANRMSSIQEYDEAIFLLTSVPNVCDDCFSQCQQQAVVVYQQKIDSEATVLLEKAKALWAAKSNEEGANSVAEIISQINPMFSGYDQVVSFRKSVEAKLQTDAKREWNFKMKLYEDNQAFKRSFVDAAKAIGVAWGQNQPRTVYKTIIRHWW